MKKRNLSLYVFYVMLALGMIEELSDDVITGCKNMDVLLKKHVIFFLCALMLLSYLVPFALFIVHLCKKWQVPKKLAVICFGSGWMIPGWICGDLNDATEALIKHSNALINNVVGAFEPALIEETLKVLLVFWILFLWGKFIKKHIFVAGMSVGLGFQLGEDLNYIVDTITHHVTSAFKETILDRLSSCLISHTMYTAVMAMGIYEIVIAHHYKKGIGCIIVAICVHALFDSMFYGALFIALEGGLLLLVFDALYHETDQSAL